MIAVRLILIGYFLLTVVKGNLTAELISIYTQKLSDPILQKGDEPSKEKIFTLAGRVVDKLTTTPLSGVNVTIVKINASFRTEQDGLFRFTGLAPGEYEIFFEKDGYLPYCYRIQMTGEEKEFKIEVQLEALRKEITITAEASVRGDTTASSLVNLTSEQIRNLPGIMDDVSRALQAIPGVASSGEFKNDLIVRGGSPSENLFVVEGIRVPSLSHFGSQNSVGGVISFLNPALVKNIEFFSGGFPACYGDTLSSVTHVQLKEGDRLKLRGICDLSLLGFRGTIEGPSFSRQGSWIFSIRKDFFSAIPRYFTMDMTIVPDYLDGQGFVVLDLAKRFRLSLLAIGAKSDLNIEEYDEPIEDRMKIKIGNHLYLAGTKLRAILGRRWIGYLTISAFNSRYAYSFHNRGLERHNFQSEEEEVAARFDLESILFSRFELAAGIELMWIAASHYLYYRGGYLVIDRMGYRFPRRTTRASLSTQRPGFYFQVSYPLTKRLQVTGGLRGDCLVYTKDYAVSPRLGINFRLSSSSEISFSYGIYYQAPETFWLNSHPENRNLRFLESTHFVLGTKQIFGQKIAVSVEAYLKNYARYPVDVANPYLTLANQGGSLVPTFFGSKLLDVGASYARGIELSFRNLSSKRFSWLANYSYSVVRFKALDGVFRPGDFDYGHIINLSAIYWPSASWTLSLRWRYNGGAPYTPFDLDLSKQRDASYFDLTRINTLRYPAYHRLDIRLEKRFDFRWLAVSACLEIQNLYNRRNVYYKFWDGGREQTVYFLPIIPFLAIKIEF